VSRSHGDRHAQAVAVGRLPLGDTLATDRYGVSTGRRCPNPRCAYPDMERVGVDDDGQGGYLCCPACGTELEE
jgi:hypothetical protein